MKCELILRRSNQDLNPRPPEATTASRRPGSPEDRQTLQNGEIRLPFAVLCLSWSLTGDFRTARTRAKAVDRAS